MTRRITTHITANFERNLEAIEQFWAEAQAPQAFDALLDELLGTVIPNLEQFPELGRPFLHRPVRSAEARHALGALQAKLAAVEAQPGTSLRDYVMSDYLVLYLRVGNRLYLLSIKHHQQLSFDFDGHWGASP